MIPALEHPDIRRRALPISVEVAVSTEAADRALLPSYASAGVADIWLVLASKKQVERFTNPVGDRYAESRLFSAGETLASTSLARFSLPLASLFP